MRKHQAFEMVEILRLLPCVVYADDGSSDRVFVHGWGLTVPASLLGVVRPVDLSITTGCSDPSCGCVSHSSQAPWRILVPVAGQVQVYSTGESDGYVLVPESGPGVYVRVWKMRPAMHDVIVRPREVARKLRRIGVLANISDWKGWTATWQSAVRSAEFRSGG